MLYPARRAFFEKLALSLPHKPAIKDWTCANALSEHERRLAIMRKACRRELAGRTKHAGAPMITETSKLDSPRSREPLFTGSARLFDKEAPQHFACEAVVFGI